MAMRRIGLCHSSRGTGRATRLRRRKPACAWPLFGGWLTHGTVSFAHALHPAAPYLAAPTDPSLARLPLVSEGHFVWTPYLARHRAAGPGPTSRPDGNSR